MKSVVVVLFCLSLCLDIGSNASNTSCGWDRSPSAAAYTEEADIETYPWMGMLFYPMEKKYITTSVVLVTRQMVIAAASEIDKLPKTDFRARARVVLGKKCDGGSEIKVRDYIYHPEFVKDSFSALAMIQLETDHIKTDLCPICQPPPHFIKPQFFALTLNENCFKPRVRLHRMEYVNIKECRNFYRRSGLDQNNVWPRHAACARAVSGGRCVWRSGAVLAVKQDGQWRLLGFSVYGPGCGDPARFVDYGMYYQWVRLSSSTVGLPAITRIGDSQLVMRRSLANIQRYGPCDPEEKMTELFSDQVILQYRPGNFHAKYNVTLYAAVEYSCVTFQARPYTKVPGIDLEENLENNESVVKKAEPKLRLRRWCVKSSGKCHGFQHIEIHFYVDIHFSQSVEFTVHFYGSEAKDISATSALKYSNVNNGKTPEILSYTAVQTILKEQQNKSPYKWFKL